MANPLPQRLLRFRKRCGFSQHEVAFLLGYQSRTRISRYERSRRLPGLEIALAYEVVFREPLAILFVGLQADIADGVRDRARLLLSRIRDPRPDRLTARKIESLKALLASEEDEVRHRS